MPLPLVSIVSDKMPAVKLIRFPVHDNSFFLFCHFYGSLFCFQKFDSGIFSFFLILFYLYSNLYYSIKLTDSSVCLLNLLFSPSSELFVSVCQLKCFYLFLLIFSGYLFIFSIETLFSYFTSLNMVSCNFWDIFMTVDICLCLQCLGFLVVNFY